VLRQDIKAAFIGQTAVERHGVNSIDSCLALQNFKTVGRDQNSFAGAIESVIGAADALKQAGRAFWGTYLHHQINRSPVDP
jgi:hypothetical protein